MRLNFDKVTNELGPAFINFFANLLYRSGAVLSFL